MLNRHQVRLCRGSAAYRAAAIPTVLPGQKAGLPSLQPIPGRDRKVRDRTGREPHRAGEGVVRAVLEAGELGGGRYSQRFLDLAVRGATQHWRQRALPRGGADREEFSRGRTILGLPQQLLFLQVRETLAINSRKISTAIINDNEID